LLWLPHIRTPTSKAKGLEAHAFQGDISSEDHQISPRNLVAVLLLDGPEEAARLVQIDVVWPRVQWGEALLSGASSTAAIADSVRASCVY